MAASSSNPSKRKNKSNYKNKKLGFTLVEMAMVILLIGILAAALVPKMANVTFFSGRFFYDDVLSSIRYAQQYAVSTGCHVQVNVTGTQVTLTRRWNGVAGAGASCVSGSFSPGLAVLDPSAPGAASYSRTAPTAITLTTTVGTWPLYFDTLGRARQVSDSAITNFGLTVDSRSISIAGETGYTQ